MNDLNWLREIPLVGESYKKGWDDFVGGIDENPYVEGSEDYQQWYNGRWESRIKSDEEKCKKTYKEWLEIYGG
jgi:coproporphyrinogen III oxidase